MSIGTISPFVFGNIDCRTYLDFTEAENSFALRASRRPGCQGVGQSLDLWSALKGLFSFIVKVWLGLD